MLQFVEFLAVIASAVYGVLLARRAEMDFVGVFAIAFTVAFGGGTLRDLCLDRHPLFWMEHAHYPVVVFVIALITSFVRTLPAFVERALPIVDACGLGLFSIAGTGYALEGGTSLFIAGLFGVLTGTFGGVMGDVICNQVPSLFRSAPLYATCAFAGCWVYIGLDHTSLGEAGQATIAVCFIVVMRILAERFDWRLPN